MRTATSLPRIYADQRGLLHGDLTERLIGIFFNLYNEIGYGFLESVYLRATEVEVALLFNFGPTAQFRRYVFENLKKNPRDPRESAEKKFPGSYR